MTSGLLGRWGSYLMRTGCWTSTRKEYDKREKHWKFRNDFTTNQAKPSLSVGLLRCCTKTISSTPQKKLYPERSISQTKVISLGSANAIVSSVRYTLTSTRQRRSFTTTRQLSGSLPLSTGPTNRFGSISAWQRCFSTNAGSATHTLTLNTPSCTWSTIPTFLVMRWSCRLGPGVGNTGSKT